MVVSTGDLTRALFSAWNASTLPVSFTGYWDTSDTPSDYFTLHDQEALPGQPLPYCVVEEFTPTVVNRMSASPNQSVQMKREIQDVQVRFHIHARDLPSESKTVKEIAEELAEEVMKVFGGHPETAPSLLSLTHGNHLHTQLNSSFGVNEGDDEYEWVLTYNFRLDVPVAVAS